MIISSEATDILVTSICEDDYGKAGERGYGSLPCEDRDFSSVC
jgi:hypothetical protein